MTACKPPSNASACSVNAKWAIHLKCLETKEEIAINADDQMDTMSTIKIPLMIEAFRQVEAGKFKLSDRITLRDEDKPPGTGTIQYMDAGQQLTIHDVITMMIIVSDNTATDMMFAKVGGVDAVNALARDWGLKQTRATAPCQAWFQALRAAPSAADFHRAGKTPYGLSSVWDMSTMLEKIKAGEAVSKTASDEMLRIMRRQLYRTRLPKYVTAFNVPHKTGDFCPISATTSGSLRVLPATLRSASSPPTTSARDPPWKMRLGGSASRCRITLGIGDRQKPLSPQVLFSS